MKCKQEDCFKCPYEDCILDEGEKPTKQRDYAEYQREYYIQHMEERKAYQRKYGLVVDGIVGIKTWKKMLGVK
jgi:murein L,D-transpeptidase YcbB/YkuD